MYFKKIAGRRVYLSPMCTGDLEQYTKWLNDSAVSDGLGNSAKVISIEREKEALDEMVKSGFNFAIVRTEDDKLIGNLGLFDINHIHRNAQCGIFIGDEENRNKGYGQEALTLLLEYGFSTLNLNNVLLKVFSFNESAIACYRKVGFTEVGRRRNSHFLHGRYYDDVHMDILPDEFFAAKSK